MCAACMHINMYDVYVLRLRTDCWDISQRFCEVIPSQEDGAPDTPAAVAVVADGAGKLDDGVTLPTGAVVAIGVVNIWRCGEVDWKEADVVPPIVVVLTTRMHAHLHTPFGSGWSTGRLPDRHLHMPGPWHHGVGVDRGADGDVGFVEFICPFKPPSPPSPAPRAGSAVLSKPPESSSVSPSSVRWGSACTVGLGAGAPVEVVDGPSVVKKVGNTLDVRYVLEVSAAAVAAVTMPATRAATQGYRRRILSITRAYGERKS